MFDFHRSTGARRGRWAVALGLVAASLATTHPAAEALPTGATAIDLAKAIAANPSEVTGASYVTIAGPTATAVSSVPIGGMPISSTTYGIMSSGDAGIIDTPNDGGSEGADLNGPSIRGPEDFDVTILKIDVQVPAGTNCLVGMDFRFYSDEYPEYVGGTVSDAFVAELDKSTWTTTDGTNVTAPDNFAFDPAGSPITINATGVTGMSAGEAAGTTFDGATPLLRAKTPITPGPHSIYLSIFDQGDQIYDSAVLLDNLRFGTVNNVATECKPGAAPAATIPTNHIALGDGLSSGEGTSSYTHAVCHRGPGAWPMVLKQHTGIAAISHNACRAAKSTQIVGTGSGPSGFQVPATPNPAVDFVTLNVGAEDVGLSKFLKSCYGDGGASTIGCNGQENSAAFNSSLTTLKSNLGKLHSQLKAAFPNATIVHVGYPRPTPAVGTTPTGCPWLSGAEQTAVSVYVQKLNTAIEQAAATAGVATADVTSAVAGHELCTPAPWVVGLGVAGTEAGFPTAAGHVAVAKAVASEMGFAYTP